MSLRTPGTKFVGSHLVFSQTLVQGKLYLRSVAVGRKPNAPGDSGAVHASAELALLPFVVNVGVFAFTSVSQGVREATLKSSRSQSGTGVPAILASQQP